ncbi:M57 family metalloprotease [Flavobacteriaceae bacterium M23B6Z8]
MRKLNFMWMIFIASMVLFSSCQKEESVSENYETVSEIPDHIQQKLKKLGFVVDEFTFAFEDGYIVEGDIMLTEAQMDQMLQTGSPSTERHFSTNNLVNTGTSRILTVWRDPAFSSAMNNRIQQALNRYNALNLRIRFQLTTNQSQADIRITLVNFSNPNVYAAAGFPTAGNPFSSVRMGSGFYNTNNPPGNTVSVIAHEIGHCIGFRHMDYLNRSYSCGGAAVNEGDAGVGANPVVGTGDGNTPNSWMLACVGLNVNRPFILTDKIALSNLYGRNRDKGNVFLRYRKSGGGHFYTSNYNEVREGNSRIFSEGIMCRIYPNGGTGRKPVYRYFNRNNGNHFYTSNFNELGNGGGGYSYEGVAGYVFSSNASGRVPIYRYFRNNGGFHFYTTNFNELGNGASGYNLEGVIGYTYPN